MTRQPQPWSVCLGRARPGERGSQLTPLCPEASLAERLHGKGCGSCSTIPRSGRLSQHQAIPEQGPSLHSPCQHWWLSLGLKTVSQTNTGTRSQRNQLWLPYNPAYGIPAESGVPAHSPRAAPSLSSHHHPLQKHLLTACPLKKQETPTIHSHPKEGNPTVLSVLLTPAKGAPVTLQGAPSGSSWPPPAMPCQLCSFSPTAMVGHK